MSKDSTIYDNILTVVAATFGSAVKLVNPYELEDNDDVILKNGYGMVFGAATAIDELRGRAYSITRNVTIKLTRQMYGSDRATSTRETTEKQLLNDKLSLIQALEQDHNIRSNVASMKYISDNGNEFVFTDRNNYLKIEIDFEVTYMEVAS